MPDALSPLPHHRLGALVTGPGWRRAVLLRRAVAGLLAAAALVLALVPPAGAGGRPVLVATADLAPGSTLRPDDVSLRTWPDAVVPAGALAEPAAAEGRVLVGAARAGEPITDVRLAGAGTAAALGGAPDAAAVPVRLGDAGVAALLTPGSRVDVVGSGADGPAVLAADAAVLTVLPPEERAAAGGRLVLVALPREIAARVASASLTEEITITLR